MRAFADEAPFEEYLSHAIEIPDCKEAFAMVASSASRSIFISDAIRDRLFKIQMPDVVISWCAIDRMPQSMSISSADELVVCAKNTRKRSIVGTYTIYVYKADTSALVNTVKPACDIVVDLVHAVKLPTDNFIIIYSKMPDIELHLVGELSADGRAFLRTFNLRAIQTNPRNNILHPVYLYLSVSVTDDGQIFALDSVSAKMFLVNPQMTEFQILWNNEPGWILGASKICYIRHKKQVLISHFPVSTCRVTVLSLSPCEVKNRLSSAGNQERVQDSDDIE